MRRFKKPEEKEISLKRIVPDTSALVSRKLSKLMKQGKLDNSEIIIPQVVVGELQAQTSRMRESGFLGLEEIKNIRNLVKKHNINLTFEGKRASYDDILLAKSGRLDSLIQETAKNQKAVLVTCDLPQALVAEAEGISVKYYVSYEKARKLKIEKYFTADTMSIHLKENAMPYAKRGKPGNIKLVQLSKNVLKAGKLEELSKEIFDAARYEEGFIEIGMHGASVVQIRNMRIAIARPPFSNGFEITAVRPIVKLELNDYKLSDKLKNRLEEKAEGILIAGPPGSGKTCFAGSLAEFYFQKGKIVKTMESPRDLQVRKEITQYGPLDGSFAKTADILLLVRPDYAIFDEIRKTRDFETFSDLRLAGIGLIGVVHASNPVDSIQRFIGRIDIGVIPHVIDTIIFINAGNIEKVYSLSLIVRVPSGMTEADLARPIVEIRDFESLKLEYEIYTYGEQTVVIPVEEEKKPLQKLAIERIKQEIARFDPEAKIEFLNSDRVAVKVRNDVVPRLIGKEGKTVASIEKKLGVGIEVEPLVESIGKEIKFGVGETGGYVVLSFDKKRTGKNVNIYIDNEYLFTATIGRKGDIKVSKDSDLGRNLLRAVAGRKEIKGFV